MLSENNPESLCPRLYLVATPIGNLKDVTLRALDVLRAADQILAEDTRRTRKLLTRYDINTPLRSLNDHNERTVANQLVEQMVTGTQIALVSDAGTPLISDPGYFLVRAALDAGVKVVPIPGPSSLLAALTGSGLPVDRFTFCGFLPRKAGARRRLLNDLASEPGTLIFLESPRRLATSLAEAAEILGGRPVAIARELTKMHEEFIRGTLPEVAAQFAHTEVRGEVTVCVAGANFVTTDVTSTREPLDHKDLAQRFAQLLEGGMPRTEALKTLARHNGVSRREIYKALFVEEEETR